MNRKSFAIEDGRGRWKIDDQNGGGAPFEADSEDLSKRYTVSSIITKNNTKVLSFAEK